MNARVRVRAGVLCLIACLSFSNRRDNGFSCPASTLSKLSPSFLRLRLRGELSFSAAWSQPPCGPLLWRVFRRTQMAGAEKRKHLAMKQQFTLQSLLIHLNKAHSDGFGALNAAFNVQSNRNYCAVWPSSRPLIVKCYREFSHSG